MKLNLTDRSLRALAPGDGREVYWDVVQKCLGVRVSDLGRKSFVVKYRVGQRQRMMTLGTYPELSLADARREAKAVLASAVLGEDPAAAKVPPPRELTFTELAEQYLELYARPRKKSWKNDEWILGRELVPAWGKREIKGIRKADVVALLEKILRRGTPVLANRTLALASRIFSWAVERDLLEHSPCSGVKRPAKEEARERVLSADEIRQLWRALDSEDPLLARFMRLLLVTAQRSGEVRLMRWADVVGDEWTIPASVAKNKRAHVVPLSSLARTLIGPRPTGSESDEPWVLPSPRRPGEPLHGQPLKNITDRLCARLGWHFTPHDLRRTASTNIGRLKVPRFINERVLNHSDGTVTGKYDRYEYIDEKREALALWAHWLQELVATDHGEPPHPLAATRPPEPETTAASPGA